MVLIDVDEWIANAATNRARIAVDEIVTLLVTHCNENSIALAVGKEAQTAAQSEIDDWVSEKTNIGKTWDPTSKTLLESS